MPKTHKGAGKLRFAAVPRAPQVLVVEDDSTVSAIVCAALEQAGYAVRAVGDCRSAREEIHHRPAEVIVMDMGLPDGNGLDIVRDLRPQADGGPAVVVLTGFRQEKNVLAAFDAGADDFMTKPFSPRELVARVAREAGR